MIWSNLAQCWFEMCFKPSLNWLKTRLDWCYSIIVDFIQATYSESDSGEIEFQVLQQRCQLPHDDLNTDAIQR